MENNELMIGAFVVLILIILINKLSGNSASSPPEPAGDITDDKIREIASGGQKVTAIKLYRQLHNVGLKEAKEAVEKMV